MYLSVCRRERVGVRARVGRTDVWGAGVANAGRARVWGEDEGRLQHACGDLPPDGNSVPLPLVGRGFVARRVRCKRPFFHSVRFFF
jgi:hypothetical protein